MFHRSSKICCWLFSFTLSTRGTCIVYSNCVATFFFFNNCYHNYLLFLSNTFAHSIIHHLDIYRASPPRVSPTIPTPHECTKMFVYFKSVTLVSSNIYGYHITVMIWEYMTFWMSLYQDMSQALSCPGFTGCSTVTWCMFCFNQTVLIGRILSFIHLVIISTLLMIIDLKISLCYMCHFTFIVKVQIVIPIILSQFHYRGIWSKVLWYFTLLPGPCI